MARPALECGACEAVELELEVGIAQYGAVECEGVCRPCSGT